MKKILKYILIYTALGIVITVSVLFFIDHYIEKINNSSSSDNQVANTEKEDSIRKVTDVQIPTDAESVQYSYDNKYYTYLEDGKIYINNIEDGKNVYTISNANPICYYNLLYDKNLILYFTKQNTSGSKVTKLKLMTYDIASQNTRDDYNVMSITNFSKIKYLEFSPVINMIYVNVEIKSSASKYTNTIYKIDLFKSMSTYTYGKVIEKMVMTKNKDRLYFENNSSTLYYNKALLRIFKEDVDLIGTDSDDNVYFINSSKDTVYRVYNNKVIDKITLTDRNVVDTYSNNESVYIIYSNYVINLNQNDKDIEDSKEKNTSLNNDTTTNTIQNNNTVTNDTATDTNDDEAEFKKLGVIDANDKFDAIKNNIMYLRTSDNKLVIEDLSK